MTCHNFRHKAGAGNMCVGAALSGCQRLLELPLSCSPSSSQCEVSYTKYSPKWDWLSKHCQLRHTHFTLITPMCVLSTFKTSEKICIVNS